MPKQTHYNAAEHISADTAADPYLRPAFPLGDRLQRLIWNICWTLLYRTSPRPFHAWRSFLLRLFGATMGANCHFYPRSKVWAPWNLVCADQVTAGDGVEIYNAGPVTLGSHAILSQDAYLCTATHDYDDPAFPLIAYAMQIGSYAWVCARASVAPGVNVGQGAVLGLGSVATRTLDAWTVYAGVPAVKIKERRQFDSRPVGSEAVP
jgi:putative colanic acid biosynthesis acetyltransferase WcaF